MGYIHVWRVLEEIAIDLKEKGVAVNPRIIDDLRAAKTLISVLKADPSCVDTDQKIEEHLLNVESALISEGQKAFGGVYVDRWLKSLEEARQETSEEQPEAKFVPGLPRDKRWIRIRPSIELPVEQLRSFSEESQVTCDLQEDGYILISGREENVKSLVKKIASRLGARKQST